MSRFVGTREQSPLYRKACSVMSQLACEESEDSANRAFAEVTERARMEAWAKAHGVRKSNGHICINRITGKRCEKHCAGIRPPSARASENVSLWLQNGKPSVLVSQPYRLTMTDLKEIIAFCEEHGVVFRIGAKDSWKFPGNTIMMTFRKAGPLENRIDNFNLPL